MSPEILGVLGFILSILLGLNAKFVWSLLVTIKNIEISVTRYVSNQESVEKRVEDIEDSRKDDKARILPIIEDYGRRIVILELEAEEIEALREAKHSYGNKLTALDGRVLVLERSAGVK